jgi:hypothetical protein
MVSLRGPKLVGPMAPDLPVSYADGVRHPTVAAIPVADIKRMSRESGA